LRIHIVALRGMLSDTCCFLIGMDLRTLLYVRRMVADASSGSCLVRGASNGVETVQLLFHADWDELVDVHAPTLPSLPDADSLFSAEI